MASTTTDRPRSKRFLPPSKSVVEPYRPTPRLLRRVSVLGVAMLVIFAVLLLRLWALQVLAGTKYVDQAAANSFRTVRVQAPRGQILDRVSKDQVVNKGDWIITRGTVDRRYTDEYPYGIPIGRVVAVGTSDIASFLTVQVQPLSDISSLDAVAALVPKHPRAKP